MVLNFLLRLYAREPESTTGKHALEMTLFTLRKMAAGGMHDHLGGGFSRYSVDQFWHVPHFEKMLYDQAQLAIAYLDAFQITRDVRFEKTARDVLDYVRRDMTAPEGGFYSAEDADSEVVTGIDAPGHNRKAEGAFYVWTKAEIDVALGEVADLFSFHYGVEANGNAPAGADPHGEFVGKNILIERHTVAETSRHFGKGENEVAEILERTRQTLFALRAKRPRPHLDDKIIAAWNGLMISAFSRGAQVLGDAIYLAVAENAATCLRTHLYDGASKTLVRNYRQGRSAVAGFADDYAFVIQGLLDLYEASFEIEWLKFALDLQETQDGLFYDAENGGYFSGSGLDPSILLRMKEDNDGAEPAASSVSALNLLRLAQIRGNGDFRQRAEETMAAFGGTLTRIPSAMPQMLVALDFSASKPRQIVIAGPRDSAATRALLREVHAHFAPVKVSLLADGAEGSAFLEEKLEALRGMKPMNGKSVAYVCENFACQAPVSDAASLGKLLS
ncbi:MAG: thioredoxin domain-containing protein [Chthoniobacterales bacterium]|nr:thioredoxin domain-containing protein [Chthoniobacterales bacterium]